jgi:hypothetical protein
VKALLMSDQGKLMRLLGYLEGTKEVILKFSHQGVFGIIANINASFSTHQDRKSHSEVIVMVGGAVLYFSSKK